MASAGNNHLKQVFLRSAATLWRQRHTGIILFPGLEHRIDHRDTCHCTAGRPWRALDISLVTQNSSRNVYANFAGTHCKYAQLRGLTHHLGA